MDDLLGPALDPVLIKTLFAVAEEQLGADHVVTKALGAAFISADPTVIEMARKLFGELPMGKRNLIWLTAKSRLASRKKKIKISSAKSAADLPYTEADLSPNRVLH
jgi:hypothetical protein